MTNTDNMWVKEEHNPKVMGLLKQIREIQDNQLWWGKEKYYQPDISELYIGYECEINPQPITNPNLWQSAVLKNVEYLKRVTERPESIRAKYLDSDDIISLGFEQLNQIDPHFGKISYLYNVPKDSDWMDGFKVSFLLKHEQGKIRIEKQMFGGFTGTQKYNEQVYYGPCKSRNELKKILEWIK